MYLENGNIFQEKKLHETNYITLLSLVPLSLLDNIQFEELVN